MNVQFRECVGRVMDTAAYILAYAPDRFPIREYLPEQMTLERAFAELEEELNLVEESCGANIVHLPRCQELVRVQQEVACNAHRSGV